MCLSDANLNDPDARFEIEQGNVALFGRNPKLSGEPRIGFASHLVLRLTSAEPRLPEWVEPCVRHLPGVPSHRIGKCSEGSILPIVLVDAYPRVARLARPYHTVRLLVNLGRIDQSCPATTVRTLDLHLLHVVPAVAARGSSAFDADQTTKLADGERRLVVFESEHPGGELLHLISDLSDLFALHGVYIPHRRPIV